MNGWIVRNIITDPDTECGDILGSDGLIYHYRFADHPGELSAMDLQTCVSYSAVFSDTDPYLVRIGNILTEERDEEIIRFDEAVKATVSNKRYLHIFRVAKIARALAERFGCDVKRSEIAGWMHDIAKENPMEENQRLIRESGMPITTFEINDHSFLHAAAGAVVAADRFGIRDQGILDAVHYHNGRPAMKDLEKIIFLSDHLDYIYKNRVRSGNDIIQEKDLDSAIFKMITVINQVFVSFSAQADPITESTMNYMFVKLNVAVNSLVPTQDSRSPVTDEMFDRSLEIASQRGLPLKSVKNIRDLGGLPAGGSVIRRGLLFRSARLVNMTQEDAARLEESGVTTVIDLRSEREKEAFPDRSTERFRVEHCPLPTLELTQYQKDLQEKFFITPPGPERTYYLSEYLSCISMRDLYMRVLTDETSLESLRRIFELFLSGQGGFLFHCTDGKDRTGAVAALLLTALGASEQDIFEDYYTSVLATFSQTEAYVQSLRKENYSEDYIDEIRYCNGIGMNIAESVRDEIVSRFGSVRNYLKNILSDEQILLLKERFLEPADADHNGDKL